MLREIDEPVVIVLGEVSVGVFVERLELVVWLDRLVLLDEPEALRELKFSEPPEEPPKLPPENPERAALERPPPPPRP